MLGVYIHIPYCRTLCPYCDFVRQSTPANTPTRFVDALCSEIDRYNGPQDADTVFFGGGTPSLLTPEHLRRILDSIRARFDLRDPEITLEANPDDVKEALADAWAQAGVTRVSLGVQSFDDRVLAYLGRRHDAHGARDACRVVADRFENWSIDLIFGAHPADAWEATLRECAAMSPPHVSAYGLTYEEGTPFGRRAHEALDEDASLACYRLAHDLLSAQGLRRYEISNHARPGHECRHNLYYWRNLQYAGFGPGAYSFLNSVRSRNVPEIPSYLPAPGRKAEELRLTDCEIRVETLIQHFRLAEGLMKQAYGERFGTTIEEDFGPRIEALIARGLLEEDDARIHPTPHGFELNNEIGLALVGQDSG